MELMVESDNSDDSSVRSDRALLFIVNTAQQKIGTGRELDED